MGAVPEGSGKYCCRRFSSHLSKIPSAGYEVRVSFLFHAAATGLGLIFEISRKREHRLHERESK